MEKQKPKIAGEFQTALSKIKSDIDTTRRMLFVFFIMALVSRFMLGVIIPVAVIFLLLAWFLFYFLHEYLIKKAKNAQKVYAAYFKQNISDLLLLTLIIHYLGGAEWIGIIFYSLVLVTSGVILPRNKAIVLGLVALFFYSSLVLFEYFEILQHRALFLLGPGLYRSISYIGVQILVGAGVFYFIAETAGTFSEILREKTKQLQKAYEEAEEAKEVLEVKVKARTYELEVMAQSLEEKVRQRTKELETKVKELEKFQKLVVGRELKMIELKKALRQAQGKIL